jgi:hypothetical protein
MDSGNAPDYHRALSTHCATSQNAAVKITTLTGDFF